MLQYYHFNPPSKDALKYTVALEVPAKSTFFSLAFPEVPKTMKVNLGIALCNPKDTYSKKLGRQVASGRLQEVELTLENLNFVNDQTYFLFSGLNNTAKFLFKTSSKSMRVYFVEML